MLKRLTCLLLPILSCLSSFCQINSTTSCGQKPVMQHFYAQHPELKQFNDQVEKILQERNLKIKKGLLSQQRVNAIVTLPVVVHIIHNNGAENISDAQVFQGIQDLNNAYANIGYYDPSDGVNTQIQFCMAQRDPSNNLTNGITRDISSYTVMGGSDYYSDDQNVKNIVRWNPLCYINIWLVKSIPTSVVGYAYLPAAHGTSVDGIIEEAAYFGSSYSNDVVISHEMGHYFGLYHTFEGACTNNDCSVDGDKVCDTPPDQSTAGISCTSTINSCNTDVLSGFATDQNDLTQDYMDYGNFNCMKVFTQGQADRMNWFIQNVRKSLLSCKSCMLPCPAPVTSNFTVPGPPIIAGNSYTFNNTSLNAVSYEWYVNATLVSTAVNFTYVFPATGSYTVRLIAKSGNALCDDDVKTVNINAVCGITAGFSKSGSIVTAGTNINFNNTSIGATGYEWYVNGVSQSTATNFSYTSSTAGKYIIKLIAKNTAVNCQQEYTDTVEYTCAVIADFSPALVTSITNTPVTFTSNSTGASTYQWLVNGVAVGSGPTLTYTFSSIGSFSVQLIAGNGICNASKTGFVYTTDKCGNAQYQYQKTYAAGINSSAIDIRATPDGGNIMAERILLAGSTNLDAALLKTDVAGNVQWMNSYTINGNSFFRRVKTTIDGGYIAIGNITPAGSGSNGNIFIVKTNASGSVAWSRELSLSETGSSNGTDIICSADGSYYFTASVTSTGVANATSDAVVGKTDAAGNLQWLNTYDARSSETANSLTEDNNHLVICGDKKGQLSTSGYLLQLNKPDGSVVWSKNYQSVDESFLEVSTLPDGYYVNGLRRIAVGGLFTDHIYLKTDFSGNITYSTFIRPFGATKSIGFASSVIKSNGNIISASSALLGGPYADFILQEVNPVSGIIWSKTYNKNNGSISAAVVAGDDGIRAAGYSLEPTGPTLQTFAMKLDSAGNAGSCPAINTNLDLLAAQYIGSVADFTGKQIQAQVKSGYTSSLVDVTANGVCQYITCDSIITPVDTCTHITFQQEISKPGSAINATDLKITGGGDFVITGTISTGRDTTAMLMYLNADGSSKWAKQYSNTNPLMPLAMGKVLVLKDGNFITTGSVADSNLIVAKLDIAGNLVWTKYFDGSLSSQLHNGGISDIINTYDDGIAFCTFNGLVTKLDKDGNLIWSRKMDIKTNGLIQVKDTILVVGLSNDLTDLGGRLVKLNEPTGNVIATVQYGSNNPAEFTTLTAIGKKGNSYFINSLSNSSFSGFSEQLIFTYDTLGVLLNISRISSIEGYGAGEITNDGVIGVLKNCFYKRQGFDNFDWSIKYPLLGSFSNLRRTPDRGFAALTSRNNSSIYLLKGDAIGRTPGCENELTRFLSESVTVRINAIPLITASDIHFIPSNSSHTVADFIINQAQQCLQSSCSSLKIQGFDSICTMNEKVLYTVKRLTQCFLPVDWQIDTSTATIASFTDSTIELVFKTTGVHILYGTLHDGCNLIKDSIAITVFAPAKTINLGPDIQLCKFSTLKLNAGSGFKTYLWNDGSTDSTLTAYNIGTYYVKATDYCGNQYLDTIHLTQAPDTPFDLGPDITTCSADTISIHAPGNYASYTWSNNYNISNTTGSLVSVWPKADTTYTVVAEIRPGCSVVDTIRINVHKSIPVNIGNDTSFCKGGLVVFSAQDGYSSYLWQDGTSAKTFSTKLPGTYSIIVTDSNGCVSKDTAALQVYSVPLIALGNDDGICINQKRVLDAGSGYASYLWQDGSINSIYTASAPGTYWVKVTSNNGCISSDTVHITGYKNIPENFLDATMGICIGRNNILHANGNWAAYLWSTHAQTPTTAISAAGDYWLQVTNKEGCSAIDTIHVFAQDCLKGIYFPNAFTPNSDSRNDSYRPIINGKVEKIRLVIYNRLGEKVFETTDPFKGWDGNYKGKPQDPNTFVWYCVYQFAGEPVTTEKGTLILIR